MAQPPPHDRPTSHCQDELERDLRGHRFIDDATMLRWSQDGYSTSRHLLTLYAIARGLPARHIVEIGFGRSTFVLARAAHDNGGTLITCDTEDFSFLLSDEERAITRFLHGDADLLWNACPAGVELAFLDFFSSKRLGTRFCLKQLGRCLDLMKTNALLLVHDVAVEDYQVGQALDTLARRRDLRYAVLPYGFGLGVVQYTGPSKYGVLTDTFVKKPDTMAR